MKSVQVSSTLGIEPAAAYNCCTAALLLPHQPPCRSPTNNSKKHEYPIRGCTLSYTAIFARLPLYGLLRVHGKL